jgi:hypothetical protein
MSVKHALKHHFIPHEGNDYHPHALHLKRAIAYGAFFSAIKVFAIVFAIVLPAEAFLAPDVLQGQADKIIALTNGVRREQGLPDLDKNAILVTSATLKAEDMNAQKYFSHVSPDGHRLSYFLSKAGYRYKTAGENLAVGFSNADEVVNAWMKSPTHYSNLIDSDFEEFGIGLVAGVFEGEPTVFVAQHFGTPPSVLVKPVAPSVEVEEEAPTVTVPVAVTTAAAVAPTTIVEEATKKKPVVEPVAVHTPAETPKTLPVAIGEKLVAPEPMPQIEAIVATSSTASEVEIIQEANLVKEEPVSSTSSVLGSVIPEKGSIGASESYVAWNDAGDGSTTLTTQILIEGPTANVSVFVSGYRIPLQRGDDGMYRGILTVPIASNELFRVIVSPTVDVTWQDGTSLQSLIAWKNPKVTSQTPWERYLQANSWLYASVPVFPVVHAIYWIALIFFSVCLLLSIVVEIRKQHPHVIAQTLCLIALIAVYLKF